MTINVGRLHPGDQWDQTLFDKLFANELWPTGLEFRRVGAYPANDQGCILMIPGRYWNQRYNELSESISRYPWVLAIRTGDEEDTFDPGEIIHNNILWWVQSPRTDREYPAGSRFFGCGFAPSFAKLPPEPPEHCGLSVLLVAQNNHPRRQAFFDTLPLDEPYWTILPSPGFTQGWKPEQYAAVMMKSRVHPCPSGPATPDTFRVFESFEAHGVPIADDLCPRYDSTGFWNLLFPDAPFPILRDVENLPGWIRDQLALWPANANKIAAWWIAQKRRYAQWLREDLAELGAI